jgi:hypothetical protein
MTEKEALRRHLSKLGKKGGPKGGKARMAMLTPKQRRELAKKAAAARWTDLIIEHTPTSDKPTQRVELQLPEHMVVKKARKTARVRSRQK